MNTATCIAKAEASARFAVTAIDARFALTPERADLLKAIVGIRKQSAADLKSAKANLHAARSIAKWIAAAADHILTGAPLPTAPNGVPDRAILAAQAARIHLRAGHTEAEALAIRMLDASHAALGKLASAEKAFRRFESAATCAVNKQAAKLAQRCGDSLLAEAYGRKASAMVGIHRRRAAPASARKGSAQ